MCCGYATNKSTKLFNFVHPPEAPFDWIKHAFTYLTTAAAAYCQFNVIGKLVGYLSSCNFDVAFRLSL